MQSRQPLLIAFEQAPLGAGLLVVAVLVGGTLAIPNVADSTTAAFMAAGLVAFALLAHRSVVSRGVWFNPAGRTFMVRWLLSLDARRFLPLRPARRAAAAAGESTVIEEVRRGRGGGRTRWYVLSASLASGRTLVVHRRLSSRIDADRLAERLQRMLRGVGEAASMPVSPESASVPRGPRPAVTISFQEGRMNREAIAAIVVLAVFASFLDPIRRHATIGLSVATASLALVAARRLVCQRVTFDPTNDSLLVARLLRLGPHRTMCFARSSHRIDRPLRVHVRTRQRTWRGAEEHDLLTDVDGGRPIAVDAPFESIAEAERAALALPQRLRR